ncbi:MAG: SAM-dependent methyltransferase [Actinomycetia bacterium]|nr:SAM-dependent methyltransferase [Actinomycetes bacterium]
MADAPEVVAAATAHRYLAEGRDYHRPHLDRELPEHGIVVDVGCGPGRVPSLYHRPGRAVIGVEPDPVTSRGFHQFSGAPGLAGFAQHLPFRTGSVDAYVGLGIVELDPDGVVAEARRVLRPGALLYVSVPFRPRARKAPTEWSGYPITAFSEADVAALLERHGFTVDRVRRSSLAWGLGRFRFLARLFPTALLREDEASRSYRLLAPLARPFANSLLVIARAPG